MERQKRARPLDGAETADVELHTRMDVEVLHDSVGYGQKWPESPLGRVINHFFAPTAAAALTPSKNPADDDGFGRPVPVPSRPKKHADATRDSGEYMFDFSQLPVLPEPSSAPQSATSSSELPSFELPDDWLDVLGLVSGNDVRLAQSKDYRALTLAVLDLEAAATAIWCNTPRSLRAVLQLQQALTSDDAPQWRDRHPSLLHGEHGNTIFNLWLHARRKTATPLRPWGVPLVPLFFVCDPLDEYFIPNIGRSSNGLKRTVITDFDADIVAAKPWIRTSDGGSGSSSRGGPRSSGGQPTATQGKGSTLSQFAAKLSTQGSSPSVVRMPLEVYTPDGKLAFVTTRRAGLRMQPPQPSAEVAALRDKQVYQLDEQRLWCVRIVPSSCCECDDEEDVAAAAVVASSAPSRVSRRAVAQAPNTREAEPQLVPQWSSLRWKTDAAAMVRGPPSSDALQLSDLTSHETACDACFN